MEDQMRRYFIQIHGSIGNYPNHIEYRKEFCKSLSLAADKDLFGRKAGEDLSDKFEFFPAGGFNYLHFLFDNRLIGTIPKGMTIEEYLSYGPVMFAIELFHFKEIPAEAPIDVEFTVNIELTNGKKLSDSYSITLSDKKISLIGLIMPALFSCVDTIEVDKKFEPIVSVNCVLSGNEHVQIA